MDVSPPLPPALVAQFAELELPQSVQLEGSINAMVSEMVEVQLAIQQNAQRLTRVHRDKKHGNILGQVGDRQNEKLQDAQVELSNSIGSLTQKTAQLVIITAAMSKVLNDQQALLAQQSDTIESQQRKINAANLGLLSVRGVSQSQAAKLVGCVERLERAESAMSAANLSLHDLVQNSLGSTLEQVRKQLDDSLLQMQEQHTAASQTLHESVHSSLESTLEQVLSRVGEGLAQMRERNSATEQRLASALSEQTLQMRATLSAVADEVAQVKQSLQSQFDHFESRLGMQETRMHAQQAAQQRALEQQDEQRNALSKQMDAQFVRQETLLQAGLEAAEIQRAVTQKTLADTQTEVFTQALESERALAAQRFAELEAMVARKADSLGTRAEQMKKLFFKKSG